MCVSINLIAQKSRQIADLESELKPLIGRAERGEIEYALGLLMERRDFWAVEVLESFLRDKAPLGLDDPVEKAAA